MAINIPAKVNLNGQVFTATIVLDDEQSFPAVLRHPIGTDTEIRNLLIDGEIGIVDEIGTQDALVKTPTGIFSLKGSAGPQGNDGLGIDFKGDWSSGIDYEINDQVRLANKIYICVVSHQSNPTNIPTNNTGVWEIYVEDGTDAGSFSAIGNLDTFTITGYSVDNVDPQGNCFGYDFESLNLEFQANSIATFECRRNASNTITSQRITGWRDGGIFQIYRVSADAVSWGPWKPTNSYLNSGIANNMVYDGRSIQLTDVNGDAFGETLSLKPFTYPILEVFNNRDGVIVQKIVGIMEDAPNPDKTVTILRQSTDNGSTFNNWTYS